MADNDNKEIGIPELLATIENMEIGMKSMIQVIVGLENRLRALEVRTRMEEKAKPKPVILNSVGGRAN